MPGTATICYINNASSGNFAQFTNASGDTSGTDLVSYVPSGADLGTWTDDLGGGAYNGTLVLDGVNGVYEASTNIAAYYNNVSPSSANYSVTANFNCLTAVTSDFVFIVARWVPNASYPFSNGYALMYAQGYGWFITTFTYPFYFPSIGTTPVAAQASMTAGQTITATLTVNGSTITATLTGAVNATWSGTDTTYTATGYADIVFDNAYALTATTGTHISNFYSR